MIKQREVIEMHADGVKIFIRNGFALRGNSDERTKFFTRLSNVRISFLPQVDHEILVRYPLHSQPPTSNLNGKRTSEKHNKHLRQEIWVLGSEIQHIREV